MARLPAFVTTTMDTPRPDIGRKRRMRTFLFVAGLFILIPIISLTLSHTKPGAPAVEGTTIVLDTVKRGSMLRVVRGLGVLVPERVRVVPADTEGRVEARLLLPGVLVKRDDVILELSNPALQQSAADNDLQLKGEEAELRSLRARIDNQFMEQRSKAAVIRSQYHQAVLDAESDAELLKDGLVSSLQSKKSHVQAEELKQQSELAEKQVATFEKSMHDQLAVQQSKVEQHRTLAWLKHRQLDELRVRAGIDGVLEEVPVEVGQQVVPGAILARVVQPSPLRARLKILEAQARDVHIGARASIDWRNGLVPGHVIRVDPAIQNGTVAVDISLEGTLPKGALPDLSIEGNIEIERLSDVLQVGIPVHGDANSTIGLFKLTANGREGDRVQVKLGVNSLNSIVVLAGLQEGDKVILSDMTPWDNYARIRIK